MKRWKLLAFAGIAAAGAAILVASSGLAASGQKSSSKAVTLVWWHNQTVGPGVKLWPQVAAEFHKLHPDITVKPVPLQNEQFQTRIPIALQSSSPPDVFQNWGGGQLVDQVKAGKVADLTKYVKPWIKSIGGSAAGWQVNGKQYAIPYNVGVVGFWYNKELFKQAGISSPPKTWPQFLATISKLKAADITPIAIGGRDRWPDAFYWDYLAVKLCSKKTIQQSAVTYNFSDPCWTKAGRLHAAAAGRRALPGRVPGDAGPAGPDELGRTPRKRQGGDGAAGPLGPGDDGGAHSRPEGPRLPRLVPVPERARQQGPPGVAARRRRRLRLLLEGAPAGVRRSSWRTSTARACRTGSARRTSACPCGRGRRAR